MKNDKSLLSVILLKLKYNSFVKTAQAEILSSINHVHILKSDT